MVQPPPEDCRLEERVIVFLHLISLVLTIICFRLNNFSRDVCNGKYFTILLNQLKPDEFSCTPLQTRGLRQRAESILQNATLIDCCM